MPAVASSNWRITFKRESLVDQSTYWIDIANTVSESDVKNLVRRLQNFGYVNVEYGFTVTL